jgi:PAS domain S-box-containing protein
MNLPAISPDAIPDGVIAVAFFSIAAALAAYFARRRETAYPWLWVLVVGLFVFGGLSHLISGIAQAGPLNEIRLVANLSTAVVASAVAAAMWWLLPSALRIPTRTGLRAANTELATQIAQRSWDDQRFRLLVEAMSDYAILMLNPEGRVASWNPGAEHIKGYTERDIVGADFSCFYTAEDRAAGRPKQNLEIAKTEGRYEGEGWRVRKDGTRFWASVVISAIRGPDGELLGYGKVTHDQTERRRVQQILEDTNQTLVLREREAAELLEATFSGAPFAIVIVGANENVLMWNPAAEQIFGFSEKDLKRSGLGLLLRGEGGETVRRILTSADAGRADMATQIAHADGSLIDVRLSTIPILRDDGSMRAVVGIMADLTEFNRTEAQLRQSQKMEAIGTLTGGLAHDFNNLLGIIIGNIEMLRDARADDAEVAELAGEALDAATRGAELTRSLLAFARRQPLKPDRLELDVLIGGQVKLLSRLLGEDIDIRLDLADTICSVVADPSQLLAALTNLATNARDAMPRGGKLTIATAHRRIDDDYAASNPDVPAGDYALIEVTDTGTGMPAEVKGRIFEPFYTTKEQNGTGLGLSMVFGFMKQSGGHITVYSEVGVGTTFRLYLPCAHGDEGKTPDLRPGGPLAGRNETILAVEDNEPLRRIVVRQLQGLGYRVLEATGAADALIALESGPIDLLFTDVVMPGGMDGFALAEQALQKQPGIKVILTSGFPQSRFAKDGVSGAFHLLSKPYRRGDLAVMVRGVLDDRPKS